MTTLAAATASGGPALVPPRNFAAHLLASNAARAGKPAYIDDHGPLNYGQLDDRVRRVAAAFAALGLRREERGLRSRADSRCV